MRKLSRIIGLFVIFGILFQTDVLFSQTTWKIMPLGDSITDGVGSSGGTGGYRDDLYQMLVDNGVAFDFVGSIDDGVSPDPDHEGHDGATAEDIDALIWNKLETYNPNIVLLHIGTNNIGSNEDNSNTIVAIESIIDKIRVHNGNTFILLSSVIPQLNDVDDSLVTDLNNKIKELYANKRASGYNIYYVGNNEVFKSNPNWASAYFSGDGFHPNDDGYHVMAQVFFNAIINVINGPGPLSTDNFNRAAIGITWATSGNYEISNGDLHNTDPSDDWGNLATFIAFSNPSSISVVWANDADVTGIGEAGIAAMLNAPTAQASGYLIIKRPNGNLNLWTIVDGVPSQDLGNFSGKVQEIHGGDEFKVVMYTDGDGHHFDCYINGNFDGSLVDPDKREGNSPIKYAGVMTRGQYNNDVDSFDLVYGLDQTPPDAITDLQVISSTASSVVLTWTATGDDGNVGRASGYDIRYSNNPIDETNFNQAEQVSNPPVPSDPGTEETFTVTGLAPDTVYYFAIKVLDEVPNYSPISNVISKSTVSAFTIIDNFNRTELGPNWVADPEFAIISGELANTSTEDRWDFMAVYKARKNPYEISIKWGQNADVQGINDGGIVCMLDAPSPDANGYMIHRRTNIDRIYLWRVRNGAPDSLIDWAPSTLPDPQAGDVFKVVITENQNDYSFDCYINGQKDATVHAPLVNYSSKYAGVMLNGGDNNNIDEFSMTLPLGAPSEIDYVSGDAQIDTVGKTLPNPLVVRLADENGNPISNEAITFSVKSGNGHISSSGNYSKYVNCGGNQYVDSNNQTWNADQAYTSGSWGYDSGGSYSTSHSISNTSNETLYQSELHSMNGYKFDVPNGTYHVTLKFAEIYYNAPGQRVFNVLMENQIVLENFDIYAAAGQYTAIDKDFYVNVGDGQLNIDFIPVGSSDPKVNAIAVQELNNIRVTDENGLASSDFTLGMIAGINKVEASYSNLTPYVFVLTGLPDVPTQISYVSGNNQTNGVGGQPLQKPFVVGISDRYNNSVPNVPVTFKVVKGGGSMVENQPVLSDSLGHASSTLVPGNILSYNKVISYTEGIPDTIVFETTITNGVASQIKYVSGDSLTGVVGHELISVLKVKTVDNNNKSIGGVPVSFVVTAGNGTIVEQQPIESDTSGFASVHFILGTLAGTNTIEARATGLSGSPVVFTETGVADVAKVLSKASGDSTAGIVSQLLKDPFVVTVTDQYGNPVAGQPVLFTVTEGGGEFSHGGTMVWDTTGANGQASVQLKLGPLAGTDNNKVKVESTGLQGSPLYFVASASPANAAKILYVSGNNQIGYVNQALANPFVVKVTDATNNPVKNHPVIFHVKNGNGTFVESSDVVATIPTDANGLAQITLKLGPIAGVNSNEVWATSTNGQNDLENSPIEFEASSKYTSKTMVYVSGNHQSAVVMSVLPNPLKVKITDANGNSVANHPVTFKVESGGGKLNESTDSLVVITNAEGIASVELQLGPNTGQNNNVVKAYATNGYDTEQLKNAPIVFEETALGSNATTIAKVAGGDNQTGVAGENLPHKIQVKVTDKYGNIVTGHPVEFAVVKGGGSLANSADTVKIVSTDTSGIAEIDWKLGPKAGSNNNKLKVSSSNGVNPLKNSPVIFTASAIAGKTDPNNSTIVATGPVPADGNSVSTITVTLYDRFMNPVPGKLVIVEASGPHNFINGPSAPTDANGQTTATLSSISAGKKTISAKDQSNNIQLSNTAEVLFVPGEAKRIVRIFGGQQTRNVGTILADSLVVQVTDDFNNPVPGVDVTFSVKSGGGIIVENQPVKSDTNGNAYIHYILGDQPGENQIQAKSQGLLGSPIFFTETGVVMPASQMSYVLGNQQTGIAGKPLVQPFKVYLSDVNGNPVKGVAVTFRIILGKGHMVHDQVTSDAYGMAASTLVLAPEEGSNIVNAESEGLNGSPITFVANGVPGTAEKMFLVSGDNQMVGVRNVSENMVVRVVDGHGNPVQGVTVHFEVTQGDASLITQADQATNVDGLAFASVKLGNHTGQILINASSDGLNGSPITFHIQALSAPAEKLLYFAGDKQNGTIGAMLPFPIQVKVVDHYDNPVPNYSVTFVITDGGGSFRENQPVQTNSAGIASVNWIMGPTSGNNTTMAVASGLQGSPVQFTAQAFNNNLPSFTAKAPNLTVMEKQNVHFVIEASDPDGDPLFFAILNKPRGAMLDSISYTQREFKWTPDYDQAGTYTLIFMAYDDKGGADRDTCTIIVENKNRLPIITAFLPEKAEFSVKPDSVINFSITAEDPDSDPLLFFWEIDGKRMAEGAHYQFKADSLGHHSIIGYVADPYDTTFHQWNLNVKTSVELESFIASSKISGGLPVVALQWVTRAEEDNVGFNVYRSNTKNGTYEKITTEIIRSNSLGRYEFEDKAVAAGYRYFYKIEDVDLTGHRTLHGPVRANVALPQEFHLSQNYPNPFNPETTIRFTLPKSGHVQLVIFNILGQKVKMLVDENRKAGFYSLIWNGRDEFGNAVPSGIYYYSIKAGKFHDTKRMILAR